MKYKRVTVVQRKVSILSFPLLWLSQPTSKHSNPSSDNGSIPGTDTNDRDIDDDIILSGFQISVWILSWAEYVRLTQHTRGGPPN